MKQVSYGKKINKFPNYSVYFKLRFNLAVFKRSNLKFPNYSVYFKQCGTIFTVGMVRYFQTIQSILNVCFKFLVECVVDDFQTIQSILNFKK